MALNIVMKKTTKRLSILSRSEIAELYEIPKFSIEQKEIYFTLDDIEKKEMESRRSLESRLHFILQLGYFKHSSLFFKFKFHQVSEDVNYIIKNYFPNTKISNDMVSQRTQLDNQSKILKLLKFKLFDKEEKEHIEEQASNTIKINANIRYIFEDLLDYLDQTRTSIPGYSTLQKIISKTLLEESERLQSIIAQHIPQHIDKSLKRLLKNDEQMYGVTILKKDAKGFNPTEVMREIDKKCASNKLYNFAKKVIPKLKISSRNVSYYASLVDYYTVDRLNELSYESVRIYLLCYVFYRFQKINDNLINSFVYYVNNYKKQAKDAAKEMVYKQKIEINSCIKDIGKIFHLFVDESIPESTPFGDIKPKAFAIVPKEQFSLLINHFRGKEMDEDKFTWEHYSVLSKRITRNIRPLARTIDFESEDPQDPLIKALDFLKEAFTKGTPLTKIKSEDFPTDFIPLPLKPYLYEKKKLNVPQYEFLVYDQLEQQLNSGKIFINNSVSFKSLKKDLGDEKRNGKLLKTINNPVLTTPIKFQLDTLKKELDPLILEVNQNIKSGENKSIKIKKNGTWTLPYKKQDNEVNNPFYEQFQQVSLISVLRFVNQHCNFIDSFSHIKPHYSKSKANEDEIFACIIANATSHGISKMGDISDISYTKLLGTSKNFIRLENLRKANDALANGISALPIFKHWNLMDNLLFSSLDGKKRLTKYKTMLSRHSSKYFGQHRGVVSYSMIANNACINTKIIGANEHESHHFFDVIYNNTSEVTPEWHCGDTHSINHVNFALLHLIGQNFVPHLKKVSQKAKNIYCFGNTNQFKDYLIIPEGQINEKLIEEEWENLQHIFASLLMKDTTQHIVIKKLSSYTRRNKTQKALWEFDKIFKSLHTAHFINDLLLRQGIRTSLNRGEGFHQLTGAIASVGGNKFRGTTELELQIWNECIRLIANSIIYYNALILSKLYETQEKLGNLEALEFIKKLSPIAWRHINLSGIYEFINSLLSINLDEMISNLDFSIKYKNAKGRS
jgi:TnpA family transposase